MENFKNKIHQNSLNRKNPVEKKIWWPLEKPPGGYNNWNKHNPTKDYLHHTQPQLGDPCIPSSTLRWAKISTLSRTEGWVPAWNSVARGGRKK